jgi:integrase/recombinase XerD
MNTQDNDHDEDDTSARAGAGGADVARSAAAQLKRADSLTVPVGANGIVTQVVHPDMVHISTWISTSGVSIHTRRSYFREAVRFLAWLQYYCGSFTRLREVSGADAVAYREFLEKPGPVPEALCLEFGLTARPWKKGLQYHSLGLAVTILSALYEFLRRTPDDYGRPILEMNPFYAGRRTGRGDQPRPRDRALSVEQWHAVMETIGALDDPAHQARCRWMFLLAYYSFLRSHEMAKLRMGDFIRLASGAWTIHVVGKGRVDADISAPPPLVAELIRYRRFQGLSDLPQKGDVTPAILPMRRWKARAGVDFTLTPASIYLIFKTIFKRAGERHPDHEEELKRASTHWMRHTGITHTLDSGLVSERFVQKQARHLDPKTTSHYDSRPIEAIAQAFAGVGAPVLRERGVGATSSPTSSQSSSERMPQPPEAAAGRKGQ